MKKITPILAATFVSASLLMASCGGSTENTAEEMNEVETTTEMEMDTAGMEMDTAAMEMDTAATRTDTTTM